MLYINGIRSAEKKCIVLGRCEDYKTLVIQEKNRIVEKADRGVHSALSTGLPFMLIGILLLLTPFIEPLKKMQKYNVSILVVILPILGGLFFGFLFGFGITFGECYEKSCSTIANNFWYIAPLLTLILTIPASIDIYKKKQLVVERVDNASSKKWVIWGILIILLTLYSVASRISGLNGSRDFQLRSLQSDVIEILPEGI